MAHPQSFLQFELFLEITVEEAFEALAMTCLVLSHLVNGVVDGIPVLSLGVLGDAELILAGTGLSVHALLEVGLGIPDYVTEQLCELGSMLSLLPGIALEGISYLGITLAIGLTAHGQIHTYLGALARKVGIEILDHFLVNAIFLGNTDDMLLYELDASSFFNELLELRSRNTALWTTLGRCRSLMNITANGANPFLLHNSLFLIGE